MDLVILNKIKSQPGMNIKELASSIKRSAEDHVFKAALEAVITAGWVDVRYHRAAYRHHLSATGDEYLENLISGS